MKIQLPPNLHELSDKLIGVTLTSETPIRIKLKLADTQKIKATQIRVVGRNGKGRKLTLNIMTEYGLITVEVLREWFEDMADKFKVELPNYITQ